VRGPGTQGSGLPHVAAPVARAWAVAAATAAVRVPAGNAEADAWTVRGWADVAIGCVALDGPGFIDPARRLVRRDGAGAFSGLDEVIRSLPVVSGGQHAARLRELRRSAGPVPPWYPDTRPVAGPIRDVRRIVWRGAGLVTGFGELLIAAAATLRHGAALPLVSAPQLAWGARYRPSPSTGHVTIRLCKTLRRASPAHRPAALDPGFHGVRAHWTRGFMAFGRVRHTRIVMLMVPACPESGFSNVPPGRARRTLGRTKRPR
jgi:hypothetical protein